MIDDVKVPVGKTPDADLLEKMADADDQTADWLDANGGAVRGPAAMPPELVTGFLRVSATARRRLATDVRAGRGIRERCSTDG